MATLPVRKKTITTSTNETYAAALKRLGAGINFSSISKSSKIQMGVYNADLTIYAGGGFGGQSFIYHPSINGFDIIDIEFNTSVGVFVAWRITPSGITFTNYSDTVPSTATEFIFWY